MFTGIVECEGKIAEVLHENSILILRIESEITKDLKVDQSVAHNGICLTVTHVGDNIHTVCAVQETIDKTTIGSWKKDDIVNLERCMKLNERLDGHIVQGHVDTTAVCVARNDSENNWTYTFQFPDAFAHLIVEKGSVCINGTSLTCFNITDNTLDVAIIPYTFEHTSIRFVHVNDEVNIEFDIIGKYVARLQPKSLHA